MNSIPKIISRAELTCKSHGSRLTEKRKRVLTGLLKSNKALSAYELTEVCKAEFDEALPVMSVYRILDFLESENLAHKLQLENKYIACSHISCDHEHEVPQFLICESCGNVSEIGLKKTLIKALKRSVEEAGYQLKNSALELRCLCDSCATSTSAKSE